MILHNKNNRIRDKAKNNRLHLILAIVFLLGGAIIFRLFNLQVLKYDLYVALASDQHQVYNKLKPERGKIFIQNNEEKSIAKLYPIASNKDFALVYAVPEKIEDAQDTAEKFYEIFEKQEVEKEVEELLDSDDFFVSLEEEKLKQDAEEIQEFKKIKRELEIELRKKEIIEDYIEKLTKENDPYEPVQNKVNEEDLKKIISFNIPGIDYIMETHRYYPERNIGSHMIGFVGYKDEGMGGRYGIEGFFEEELSGKAGSVRAERSAAGELIIINDREYSKPENGADLVLTINRSIQFAVCTKLNEAVERHGADGGSAIVMNPESGAIIAMCSWPDYDPNYYNEVEDINIYNNPVIFGQYEPGSIFKVFTVAAGLDQGKINPSTTYNDKGQIMIEGWPKPIKNSDFETHGPHGVVDMTTVLEESLNTGSIYIMQKIGADIFGDYVKKFGFGEKTGIELETEGVSNIKSLTAKRIRPVEAATASFGQGITATPLQIISAYSAIANGGILMKPYLVSELLFANGKKQVTQPKQIRRVISERTALLVSGMMVRVVDGGHAKHAGVQGYFVAGKTGTAQVADKEKAGYSEDKTIHSFVGFAPVDEPKFVMLVKLNDPKDVKFSASSAAPLFGEIADFILNYYQVPKER